MTQTTATKKAATKKAATTAKPKQEPLNDALFYIEADPPPLPLTTNQEKQQAFDKILNLATECKVAGAIVIPAKYRLSAMRIINKALPAFKWQAAKILGNGAAVRIYKKEFPPNT